jgi:predicted DNA-binding transcriptional regulator AlpA
VSGRIGTRYQSSRDVLVGMDKIAAYMGISVPTLYRWRRKHNFPARPLPSGQVATSIRLIDQWMLTGRVEPANVEKQPTIGKTSAARAAEIRAEMERGGR